MEIIKVENLNYIIENNKILSNVNFSLKEQDFMAVLGPNGAGKTTLIEMLTGMKKSVGVDAHIDPGRCGHLPIQSPIIIYNKPINKYKRKELSKKIAYVPQIVNFDYDFTVEEIVLMGRIPHLKVFEDYGMQDVEIAKECMEKTNVYQFKDRSIHTLSGGERQRVVIARALAQKTPILILDEPISNLDIYQQIELMEILNKLNKEEKITILSIIHDMNIALKYCNKAVLLKQGEVVQAGNTSEVITKENIKQVFNIDVNVIKQNNQIYVMH